MERKFISGNVDKYFLFNNVPKMAEKRAYISAVVRAWGLSGIFTQDMEDLESNPVEEEKKEYDRFASLRSNYFAQKVIKEMNEEQRHNWNLKYIGKKSTKDFDMKEWQKACELARLQSNPMEFEETEEQHEEEQPQESQTRRLLISIGDKFNLKEADILNFFEASYINTDKNMSEDLEPTMRKVLNDPTVEEQFNFSYKLWAKWINKHNGSTEGLLNALAVCKDRDFNIVKNFFKRTGSNKAWNISDKQMQEWQQILSDTMSEMKIETAFIMKVCPSAVPF